MAQSLYRQASLIMNPYGAKDDLLPSIKPTDGSGDFTFSRDGAGASPATRVNASGLIEKGRENNFLQSNTFSNASWDKNNSSVTGGQTGYDGSSDAWLLTEDSATAEHRLRQNPSFGGVCTISVYAKANTRNWLWLRGVLSGVNVRAWFNLSTGTLGSTDGAVIDHKIEAVGATGWYKCSMTLNHTSAFENYIGIANGDLVTSYAGDGTSSIFVQDAQLESGLVATDYIETTTAPVSAGLLGDMPRLDYSGGATCPSLLLEPSMVNLVPNSEHFAASTWIVTATLTPNAGISPEGVQNAYNIAANSGLGNGITDVINIPTSGVAYTSTIYYKSAGATTGSWRLFDGSTGGSTTITLEPTSEWKRAEITRTAGASTTQLRIDLFNNDGDLLIYGAQVEAGSYPTSYIPTYGSAAPRAADSALGSFNGDGIFSSNWTAFCELVVPYEATTSGTAAGFTLRAIEGSTTNSNWSALLAHSSSTELTFNLYNGVSIDTNVFTYNWGTTLKVAVRYDGAYFINGTKYTSSITPQEPVEVSFGRAGQANASAGETAEIKQTLAFPTALTDDECIALTTI